MDTQASRWRFRLCTRAGLRRIAWLLLGLTIVLAGATWFCCSMPGRSHAGPLHELSVQQRALSDELRAHVRVLAGELGGRSTFNPRKMSQAAGYILDQLHAAGYRDVAEYPVPRGARTPNLEVTIPGTDPGVVVIGAHYDAFQGTPGADDNASGVAALLAIARRASDWHPRRTLRLVFFVNEEPPNFQTGDMGSWVYAKVCRARSDDVRAMLSLESIGYYSDAAGSQRYPLAPVGWLYPDRGNFVAFIGNLSSRSLVRQSVGAFRACVAFPSEGAAMPEEIAGVGFSDHWAFWQEGYPGIMVTGTAMFRNPGYHGPDDTPGCLDYERLARVSEGLLGVARDLTGTPITPHARDAE